MAPPPPSAARKPHSNWRKAFAAGCAIPAHPLALNAQRKLDERRQRALSRYYLDAGAGGLAVAVHTTQFATHEPQRGLLRPVLELAMEEMRQHALHRPVVAIGGVVGQTKAALAEAKLLQDLGYHAALVSPSAIAKGPESPEKKQQLLLAHVRAIAEIIPVVGFYLQPAVGGLLLPYSFWRQLAEIENLIGIKIAPFNRYYTLDVLRAVADSGRHRDIALYTGNDDNIVLDLVTEFTFSKRKLRFVGGLLGHWSVWTKSAVALHRYCAGLDPSAKPRDLLQDATAVTDTNAVFFDVAHNFHGCIAGLHEVLRRQGLLEGIWCLDPNEGLSPGQSQEIDRIYRTYPHWADDAFVKKNLDRWLR